MNTIATSLDDAAHLAEVLRPALQRIARALRGEVRRAGVSALDAQLLGMVKKSPGICVGALAQQEQVTSASKSGHIKRLERAAWIERSLSQDGDRRRTGLTLSAKGRKAVDAIRRSRNDWLATRLAALNDQERGLLAVAAETMARLSEDRA